MIAIRLQIDNRLFILRGTGGHLCAWLGGIVFERFHQRPFASLLETYFIQSLSLLDFLRDFHVVPGCKK